MPPKARRNPPLAVPSVRPTPVRSEYRDFYRTKPVANVPPSQRYHRHHDAELIAADRYAIPNAHTHPARDATTSVSARSLVNVPTPDVSAIGPTGRTKTTAVPAKRKTHPTGYLRVASTSKTNRGLHEPDLDYGCNRYEARKVATASRAHGTIITQPTRARSTNPPSDVPTRRAASSRAPASRSTRAIPYDGRPVTISKHMDPGQMLGMIDALRDAFVAQQEESRLGASSAPKKKKTTKKKVKKSQAAAASYSDVTATSLIPTATPAENSVPAEQLRDAINLSVDRLPPQTGDSQTHTQGNNYSTSEITFTEQPTSHRSRPESAQPRREGRMRGMADHDVMQLEQDYWRHSESILEQLEQKLRRMPSGTRNPRR